MSRVNTIEELIADPKIKVILVAHDIRSAYNVGAMFRTADGTGITGIVLSGYSPNPENPKLKKTALGAEESVSWVVVENLGELLKIPKVQHFGLELTPRAQNIFEWSPLSDSKIFLYVGNEVTGLSAETMTVLDNFVQLPMNGKKVSLNVAEAASIALYELLRKLS